MSEPLWFFAGIAYVRVSRNDTGDRFSILELEGPPGDTPPLHVHHTEDEVFHILEGSARFHIGSEVRDGSSGDFVLVPKGIPHTFIVGDEAARWLVITSPGDFERFVLAVGRPAEAPGFPPPPARSATGRGARAHQQPRSRARDRDPRPAGRAAWLADVDLHDPVLHDDRERVHGEHRRER